MSEPVTAEVDHLVVACASLEQGVAWCEAALGVTPGPGGKHALMGTHNRLLHVGSGPWPRAYLELIAIDPQAPPPARRRWFGLDDAALQARLKEAPRLIHWVAGVRDLDAACRAWASRGLEPGPAVAAERATDAGVLRWRLTVRDDGQLLCAGALPTLIEWQERHPVDAMAPSGVTLQALELASPSPVLAEALAVLRAAGVQCRAHGSALEAVLRTPRGEIRLSSDPAESLD